MGELARAQTTPQTTYMTCPPPLMAPRATGNLNWDLRRPNLNWDYLESGMLHRSIARTHIHTTIESTYARDIQIYYSTQRNAVR